jgi:hypothetical protein
MRLRSNQGTTKASPGAETRFLISQLGTGGRVQRSFRLRGLLGRVTAHDEVIRSRLRGYVLASVRSRDGLSFRLSARIHLPLLCKLNLERECCVCLLRKRGPARIDPERGFPLAGAEVLMVSRMMVRAVGGSDHQRSRFGHEAAALGWLSLDLFGTDGFARAPRGAPASSSALTATR